MKLLNNSSRATRASHVALTLSLVLLATAGADAQKKADPPATQSYESILGTRSVPPRAATLRPIVAGGSTTGFVVLAGTVTATEDGGATWSARGSLGGEAIAAIAAQEGWRCVLRTGKVLCSTDGGRTWTTETDLVTVAGVSGASAVCGGFTADGEAWAALDGTRPQLLVTASGAWKKTDGVRGVLASGWRSADTVVAIAGTGDVYRGGVGGEGLRRVASLQGPELTDVAFADGSLGWITTANGLVLETHDGGTTWLPRPVVGAPRLEGVGLDGSIFWVVGHEPSTGSLWVSSNSGVTWRRAFTAAPPLSRPARVGSSLLVVDGKGGLWTAATLDGAWRRTGAVGVDDAKQKRSKKRV